LYISIVTMKIMKYMKERLLNRENNIERYNFATETQRTLSLLEKIEKIIYSFLLKKRTSRGVYK
jgi:hypothetical protein